MVKKKGEAVVRRVQKGNRREIDTSKSSRTNSSSVRSRWGREGKLNVRIFNRTVEKSGNPNVSAKPLKHTCSNFVCTRMSLLYLQGC